MNTVNNHISLEETLLEENLSQSPYKESNHPKYEREI